MNRHGFDDDTFAFELSNADTSYRLSSSQTLRSSASTTSEPEPVPTRRLRSRLPHSQKLRGVLYTLPLLISLAPLVVLATLSPRFSRRLDANACLPSGDFVLPGTTSIWERENFFTITLGLTGPARSSCSYGSSDIPVLACIGYSFTQAKAIDVAWDVIVGRGGQFLLVAICYRVFREVLRSLMDGAEVGYDMFSAVAFHTGTFESIGTLVCHALGQTPIPLTRRAVVMYWMMLVATLYVVCVPTLFSAMTGYTSVYAPFLDFVIPREGDPSGLVDCGDSFIPAWGKIGNISALGIMTYGLPLTIGYQEQPHVPLMMESGWIEYYHRYYDQIYKDCPEKLTISSCRSAQTETLLHTSYPANISPYWTADDGHSITPQSNGVKVVPAPAPGIIPYPNTTLDVPFEYTHYACGYTVVALEQMTNIAGISGQEVTGICRAGSSYAWGFSFLLTFWVGALNLTFVLLMYALWFGRPRHRSKDDVAGSSRFKDAVIMVAAAQAQYGDGINGWTARSLGRGVLKGYLGMGNLEEGGSEEVVKRRKRREAVGGVAVIRD